MEKNISINVGGINFFITYVDFENQRDLFGKPLPYEVSEIHEASVASVNILPAIKDAGAIDGFKKLIKFNLNGARFNRVEP